MQRWATLVAARTLDRHAPLPSPGGRLLLIALGTLAESMAEGATALFGAAIDEAVIATPRSDGGGGSASGPVPRSGRTRFSADPVAAGEYLGRRCASIGPLDRVLLLLSAGATRSVCRPLAPVTASDLIDLEAEMVSARLESSQIDGVLARLDGIRGGGLAAAVGAGELLALEWGREETEWGPAGSAPPSGRAAEIELRRGGVEIPSRAIEQLRGVGAAHPVDRPGARGERNHRRLSEGTAALDAALQAARRAGTSTTVLTDSLQGDPEAAGRGMARVARAIEEGLGGLALPAVALAWGRLEGGPARHDRLRASAGRHLEGGGGGAVVEVWSPVPGGNDLVAVIVTDARDQLQSVADRNSTGI